MSSPVVMIPMTTAMLDLPTHELPEEAPGNVRSASDEESTDHRPEEARLEMFKWRKWHQRRPFPSR